MITNFENYALKSLKRTWHSSPLRKLPQWCVSKAIRRRCCYISTSHEEIFSRVKRSQEKITNPTQGLKRWLSDKVFATQAGDPEFMNPCRRTSKCESIIPAQRRQRWGWGGEQLEEGWSVILLSVWKIREEKTSYLHIVPTWIFSYVHMPTHTCTYLHAHTQGGEGTPTQHLLSRFWTPNEMGVQIAGHVLKYSIRNVLLTQCI